MRCRVVFGDGRVMDLSDIHPIHDRDPFEEDSDVTGGNEWSPGKPLIVSLGLTPSEGFNWPEWFFGPKLKKPNNRRCEALRPRRIFAQGNKYFRWETDQNGYYEDSMIPMGERFNRESQWVFTRHLQRVDHFEE